MWVVGFRRLRLHDILLGGDDGKNEGIWVHGILETRMEQNGRMSGNPQSALHHPIHLLHRDVRPVVPPCAKDATIAEIIQNAPFLSRHHQSGDRIQASPKAVIRRADELFHHH